MHFHLTVLDLLGLDFHFIFGLIKNSFVEVLLLLDLLLTAGNALLHLLVKN
jgi:hypothetical protein